MEGLFDEAGSRATRAGTGELSVFDRTFPLVAALLRSRPIAEASVAASRQE